MMLIILFVVNLWVLVSLLRFEYENYCQRNQGKREEENADRKINDPLGLNLGVFGKPNLQGKSGGLIVVRVHRRVTEKTENLVGVSGQKPLMLFKVVVRFRNFFWRLSFGKHKSNDVDKQPNEKS